MKYGIYYAYWEQEWTADYFKYIEKAKELKRPHPFTMPNDGISNHLIRPLTYVVKK